MKLAVVMSAALVAFTSTVAATPEPVENCLKICYSSKPTCTAPSYPKQTGDCWTCCTA